MRPYSILKTIAAAVFATAILAMTTPSPSLAKNGNVTLKRGIVRVDERGAVVVFLLDEQGEVVEPANAKGLYQAGQIEDGDEVDVKIVEHSDKRHKHRGHVTILK